jgi:uncharacterized protein (TIGR03382 family)
MVVDDVPEIGVKAAGGAAPQVRPKDPQTDPAKQEPSGESTKSKKGCGCASQAGGADVGVLVLGLSLLLTRRRRSRV